MRHEIVLADTARERFKALTARWPSLIRDGMETRLRHEPMKASRGRGKRPRDMAHPGHRPRLDEQRVFYDVEAECVTVLAIVPKTDTEAWLREPGEITQ